VKKLVAYITSSYPDNNFTIDLASSLAESGVDFLELGVPFSDPVADGPVIEEANLKALQQGFKIKDLFEISKEIAPHEQPQGPRPQVLMHLGFWNRPCLRRRRHLRQRPI